MADANTAALDLEALERDVRLNQLSNRQLAKNYSISEGLVRKLAKKHGWKRDLGEKVRARVQDEVVRTRAKTIGQRTKGKTDAEVVEAVAKDTAGVVLRHQTDLARQREVIAELVEAAAVAGIRKDEIAAMLKAATGDDPKALEAALKIFNKFLGLGDLAVMMRDFATAYANVVKAERTALNLDTKEGDQGLDLAEQMRQARERAKG